MKKEFTRQKDQFIFLIDQHVIPVFTQKLQSHVAFLEAVQRLQKRLVDIRFDPNNKRDWLTLLKKYKQDLIPLVEDYFDPTQPACFDDQFADFEQAVDTYCATLDKWEVRIQEPERFSPQPEDAAWIRMGKSAKRACFAISKIPGQIHHFVSKLVNERPEPVKSWSHRIALKNLTQYYLKEILSHRLMSLLTGIYEKKCGTSLSVWKADDEIVAKAGTCITSGEPFRVDGSVFELSDNALADIREEMEKIRAEILRVFEEIHLAYESAFYKVGTFELSNRTYRQASIRKKHRILQNDTISLEKGWLATCRVLRDDWQIDNELFHLIFAAFASYYSCGTDLKSRLTGHVFSNLSEIKDYLNRSKKRFEGVSNTLDLKKIIEGEKDAIASELIDHMIPAINEAIASQDFPSLVNQVESTIYPLIQTVSTKRSILRNPQFTTPTRSSSISFVSPFELINFENWPSLFTILKQCKITLIQRLDLVQNSLTELGQIALFNLESAVEFHTEELTSSSLAAMASGGHDRTLERLEEVRKNLLSLEELWDQELFQGLLAFSENLKIFTNNNNIIELKVRIAKAKALKQSRLIRHKLIRKTRDFFPLIPKAFAWIYQESRQLVSGTFKRYGIAAKPDIITSEIADFLADTKHSIQKLPFVYQRLFRIEALTEPAFFIGRNPEKHSLMHAYMNWMKGRFAATLVVGEKGSGVTSLMNIFLKDLPDGIPVLHVITDRSICARQDLFSFLNDLFGKNLTDLTAWADYLNNQEKQIVVLEDIQRLYLKKVNGFEALKELTELVSLTSKHIFWVMSCTEYAFAYLDKTILISDHFGYLVRLGLFDDDTMVEIIQKRHVVSGYNIWYEPAASNLISKKFNKLSDEEKQAVLYREYFSDLNKNVKSNISLALIYWLRSVRDVSGNTILIRSLKDIDLSFLTGLSSGKLFALCAFILHERLSEENLGVVLNIKTVEARRLIQILSEDGILVSNAGYFSVNPLLYMKTIALLKNKNIIH